MTRNLRMLSRDADLRTMASTLPTLLLIPGFPLDHSLWDPQVKGLEDVARVLTPDLRGSGTDQREVPAVMTMDDHAEDLYELLDGHGVERVVLCGLSMGGYVAMAFAARWPERVQALVLANTRATADDAAGRAAREEIARQATEKGMAVLARGMLPMLLSPSTRTQRPELVSRVQAMIARQRPEWVAASARGMALRPDRMALLRSLTVPALVITGDADELMTLAGSQAMADAIPDPRLVVLPGAAHLSNMEQPEAFNTALRNFLAVV